MSAMNTFVISDSSELGGESYNNGEPSEQQPLIFVDSGEDDDQEDVIVMTTTTKQQPSNRPTANDECFVIEGLSADKRKRRRGSNYGWFKPDCSISHVSHDSSRDQDIQYISTKKVSPSPKSTTPTNDEFEVTSTTFNNVSNPGSNTSSSSPFRSSINPLSSTFASNTSTPVAMCSSHQSLTPPLSSTFCCSSCSMSTNSLSSSALSPSIPSWVNFLRSKRKKRQEKSRNSTSSSRIKTSTSSRNKKPSSSDQTVPTLEDTTINVESLSHDDRDASLFIASSSAPFAASLQLPSWWKSNCAGRSSSSLQDNFTLMDLNMSSMEARLVLDPLIRDGFEVIVIQRIQSPSLWRRYIGEVKLFLEERGQDAYLNEKLLYHCSRATKQVICAEGLDIRLSNNGHFGRGIYFSDKPKKCDCYCSSMHRYMFACKVILGDIKKYPNGTGDSNLTREPQKLNGSYYDSVLGYMSIGEEYIVYNNYRTLPLYYIEYNSSRGKRIR